MIQESQTTNKLIPLINIFFSLFEVFQSFLLKEKDKIDIEDEIFIDSGQSLFLKIFDIPYLNFPVVTEILRLGCNSLEITNI